MCGIAGIVRFDRPAELSRPAVELMLNRLGHRGPDHSRVVVNSYAALGNARLSFLDRANGTQPMTSPDGRWHLTYNGEVYNWRELRDELRDRWEFRTDCDTEVVLAALVLWGEAALLKFNGMFAFFLWDERTYSGLAARDRLGVKPFVFSNDGSVFSFASEAKALIAAFATAPRVNSEAVLEYLIAPYFSGVEQPMFESLQHLLPGECLRVSRENCKRSAWWDWRVPAEWQRDRTGLAEALSERLQRSVGRASHGDHPVGSFLSGGLDSTLLTSLAAQSGGTGLRTFAIQFQEQAEFDYDRSLIVRSDDTPFAGAAARQIGTHHTTVTVLRDRLPDELRAIAAINDTLPAWEQELAQHHLAKAAREAGLRCVLVGDAADEIHYGYPFLLDTEVTRTPGNIFQRFGLPLLNRECGDAQRKLEQHYRELAEAAGHRWDTSFSCLLATTYLIVKRWLPRLLQNGDLHSMAFSIESRVPFADTEIIDLSQCIHPSLAINSDSEKNLLRQAARGLMPEANRVRPKSALPKDQRSALIYQREGAHAIQASGDFLGAWLDLAAISELCRNGRILTEAERALLFRVICLHHWRQHHNVRLS